MFPFSSSFVFRSLHHSPSFLFVPSCLHIVTESSAAAKAILTHAKKIIRPMYSNPPKHGAEIVELVPEILSSSLPFYGFSWLSSLSLSLSVSPSPTPFSPRVDCW
jgi:hypothetical protein